MKADDYRLLVNCSALRQELAQCASLSSFNNQTDQSGVSVLPSNLAIA